MSRGKMQKRVSEQLKKLINILGLNYKEFSRKTGIPYRTLQNYLSGEREPNLANLQKIATQMSVNLNWLLTGEGEMYVKRPIPEATPAVMVPVLGRVPAGFPTEIPENEVMEYVHLPDVPPNSFVLVVKGESMSPKIKDGDYIVFIPNGEIKNGDTVVVNNEWGETMLKKYCIDKRGEVFLLSENPEYPPFKVNEHYRIIGKVIDGWRKVKI